MHCPVDNASLLITERSGIEIDYCPDCRGVWLDRGELDKMIQGSESHSYEHRETRRYKEENDYRRPQHNDSEYHDNHHKKHKKESFLGDMFDF